MNSYTFTHVLKVEYRLTIENNNVDDIQKGNKLKSPHDVSYYLCEKKYPDQHMQLLSLISTIKFACVDKLLHAY